jgi:hypothetical protein
MFEKKIIDNPLRKGNDRKETEKVYAILKKEVVKSIYLYIISRKYS